MLVLALQFSRSDADQQRRRAERSGPPAVAEGRLPQNGREDGAAVHSAHRGGTESLDPSYETIDDAPVHQQVCLEPGGTCVHQRLRGTP